MIQTNIDQQMNNPFKGYFLCVKIGNISAY